MSGGVFVVLLKTDFVDADATATVHAAHHNALATAINSGGSGGSITLGAFQNPITGMYHAADFGANGGADDTAAIQAAINAAAATAASTGGGGPVLLNGGYFNISTTLVLGKHVTIRGGGMIATTIKLTTNANCHVIANFAPSTSSGANADYVGIRDLSLDGNRTNQNGAGPYYGVYFSTNPAATMASGDSFFDMHHTIDNVRVYRAQSDGFHFDGRSAIQVINAFAQQCNGYGFSATFDTHFTHCESDSAVLGGFYLDNGSIRLSVCKAYLSSAGPGYALGSNANGIGLTTCEAQNNYAQGFYLNGSGRVSMAGCVADSNNNNTDGHTYPGIELLNSSYNVLDLVTWQSTQGGTRVGNQNTGLRMTGTSANNSIMLSHSGLGTSVTAAISNDTSVTGSYVVANGTLLADSVVNRVQSQVATSGGNVAGTTVTVTLGATPTVGNLLVGYFVTNNGVAGGTSTIPSGWTQAATNNLGGDLIVIAYRKVQSGDGTSYTIGHSAASGATRIGAIEEISGLTSGTLDAGSVATAYSGATPAVTVAGGGTEYVVGVIERQTDLNAAPTDWGTNVTTWTLGVHGADSGNACLTVGSATPVSAGSYAAHFSSSGLTGIAAFK